jgi:sialate O-acetylesterase
LFREIFLQGESNANTPALYATMLLVLISDWRKHWAQGECPFLFVQLPNFNTPADRAALREAQAKALSVPGNGMAVTVDVGDPKDLHPRAKAAVGARLALAAPRVAYGETVVDSGPVFRALQTEGSRVRITFENTGGGLVTNPVPEESVNGFVVVGEDGVFFFAHACIERDGVRVLSKEVPSPVAVRYAWSNAPEVNLSNREGLPARPFRTNTGPLGQR